MDAVALIRHEWDEGARKLEAERVDARRYERLVEQLDTVLGELRKQVGSTFTLADLAHAYRDSERWARELVAQPRDLSLVLAAAFHAYQRGAVDYAP